VFVYGLMRQMKRIKLCVKSNVKLLRIDTADGMESLRAMLGLTITYGLCSKKASVLDSWVPLKNNYAVNYVVVVDEKNSNDKFVPIPAASASSFDFIHNGKNALFLRTHYHKALYRSDGNCMPLE
jgi:hypothetical protein